MLLNLRKITLLFIVISCVSCKQNSNISPQWPEIKTETKPWTRWWWHGSAVTKEGITAELEAYKNVGIGGVEITPIYGVFGEEDQFIDYLSPEWVDMLIYTLEEAKRLGLGVDMATGTGWPFGGPWVSAADACKNMVYKTYKLSGGQQLNEPLSYLQEPMVRAVGNHIYEMHGIYKVEGQKSKGSIKEPALKKGAEEIKIEDLVEPVEANENLQALALDQIRYKKQLPLQVLIAYSDGGEKINLTENVNDNGRLQWTAPKGNWTLYAVFQGWHGKMVERAAPGGEGNVIDHFDRTALENYLSKFDSTLSGRDISSLRAFFNDSYEVDDARGSADFTSLLFEEFKKRKGYDLLEHLPALFANDTEEKNERVLCDYRETISELILENFTKVWKEWAHKKGAVVRNQAHGSPANILDLYEVVDIPEMEGTEMLRIKMATSSSNVSGKRLTSSESATWLNEHFRSNLAHIKGSLDRFMLSGVNHVVYHGTCYSPPGDAWPGRLFYAAVHVNPRNSMWNDFAKLNHYAARCQSFLQNSKPDNDVLLYLPIYDRFSTPGNEMLEHFDGVDDRQFGGTAFKEGAEIMLEKGYAFDYISDKQISKTGAQNGYLKTTGNLYKTIIIPRCKYIPLETLEKTIALAEEGATVVAYQGLPQHVAGMSNLEEKKERFTALLSKINSSVQNEEGMSVATLGKGKILIGNDLNQLLKEAGARKETLVDQGLQFVRKKSTAGTLYFIANQGSKKLDSWIPLNLKAQSAFLFDPMTARSGKAELKTGDDGLQVYLQLEPSETIIIEVYEENVNGPSYPLFESSGEAVAVSGEWHIKFVSGGPELPTEIKTSTLQSWTNYEEENTKSFSGTAVYSTTFDKPQAEAGGLMLNLGEVHETAEVSLNGQVIDTLLGPVYKVLIPGELLKDKNNLTIRVSNLMANRIAHMDKNNVFWKKFYNVNFPARLAENRKNGLFDASYWEPVSSGLVGPVMLTPVEEIESR